MAQVQQVISQQGPLPIQVRADIETDAPTVITIAGSVWSPTANSMIGVTLYVDSAEVAEAQIFSNQSNEHRAFVPLIFPYTFSIGQHEFTLEPSTPQTTSDANDFFYVTVQY